MTFDEREEFMGIMDNEGHDPMGFGNAQRRTQPERDRDIAEGRILELRAILRDVTTVLEKRNAALREIADLDDVRCDEAPTIARRALMFADGQK